jgi:predicted phosphoribosyltransferase
VILVDDGVATGSTVKAAIRALREEKLEKLVVAIPVAPPETALELGEMADELICLETPEHFLAVGMFYRVFEQVSDDEVVNVLKSSKK